MENGAIISNEGISSVPSCGTRRGGSNGFAAGGGDPRQARTGVSPINADAAFVTIQDFWDTGRSPQRKGIAGYRI